MEYAKLAIDTMVKMMKFVNQLNVNKMGFNLEYDDLPDNELRLSFWYMGTDYKQFGICTTANTSDGFIEALNLMLNIALEYLDENKKIIKS